MGEQKPHACIYMYVYMYVYMCTHMYIHSCIHVHVRMCIYTCTCIYVCIILNFPPVCPIISNLWERDNLSTVDREGQPLYSGQDSYYLYIHVPSGYTVVNTKRPWRLNPFKLKFNSYCISHTSGETWRQWTTLLSIHGALACSPLSWQQVHTCTYVRQQFLKLEFVAKGDSLWKRERESRVRNIC